MNRYALAPLPVLCPLCATDQYAPAALLLRQQESAAARDRFGLTSPEARLASLHCVTAMAEMDRRMRCGMCHGGAVAGGQ